MSEQQAAIREVEVLLAKKDFYDILGVSKNANDEDLKKAYRRLALKFHPDKNKTEKAEQVFKKVAEAYDCLSNPDKRATFDRYGNEKPEQHYQQYRQHYNQDDLRPEDLFNFFFGGAFQQQPQRRQQQNQHTQQQHNPQQNTFQLFQLLPLLLFLFSSQFMSFFEQQPLYAFQHTKDYNIKRITSVLQVIEIEYYVKPDFHETYDNSIDKLRKIEFEIENSYIQTLHNRCYQESAQKQKYEYYSANSFYRQDQIRFKKLAEATPQDSCDKIRRFKQAIPNFERIY